MAHREKRLVTNTPPLVAAAIDGNLPLVTQLVSQGQPLNARDKNGATALYWACCRGHVDVSQFLLNAGSDINARVISGATALLGAADNGQDVCVRQLLKKKADVNTTNDRGDTPLHAAAYRGYVSIIYSLMEAEANPFLKNSASMTPLQEAVAQRQYQCVSLLQQYMNVVPGFPGSICLSSPDLSSIILHSPTTEESHKSWPYVPASNISRLSPETRNEKTYSLRIPKIDNIFDNDGDAFSICSRSKPAINPDSDYSVISQSTMVPGNNQNRELPPSSPKCLETHFRDSLNLDSSSFSKWMVEGDSASTRLDSLLLKDVPIIYKPYRQVIHRTYSEPPNPVSSNFNKMIETSHFSKRLDIMQESEKQYKIEQKIPHVTEFLPRDTPFNSRISYIKEKDVSLSHSAATHTVSPKVNPVLPGSEKRMNHSEKAHHVFKDVLPGANAGEFVKQHQFQMREVQEKLIQSNLLITQLREELLEIQRENSELKAENSTLRNVCSQNEPFILRARGVSDSADDLRYVSNFPELSQPVKDLPDKSEHAVLCAGSRRAVENSEKEDRSL